MSSTHQISTKTTRRWSYAETETLKRLHDSGNSYAEIGLILGRTPTSIATKLSVIGLFKARTRERIRKNIEDEIRLEELEDLGLTVVQIAMKLKRSHAWVSHRLGWPPLVGQFLD